MLRNTSPRKAAATVVVSALFAASGCQRAPVEQRASQTQSVQARPTPPRQPNGVPAIEGKYFAEEAMFVGECIDSPKAGGGCWSVRLFPDGTAEHMYVDVLSRETYTIEGGAVRLRTSDGKEIRLESKDGLLTIGDYKFVPPGATSAVPASPAYVRQ